jgi:hypothetical protein
MPTAGMSQPFPLLMPTGKHPRRGVRGSIHAGCRPPARHARAPCSGRRSHGWLAQRRSQAGQWKEGADLHPSSPWPVGTSDAGDEQAPPRPRGRWGQATLATKKLRLGRVVMLRASSSSCCRRPRGPHPRATTVGNVRVLLPTATIPCRNMKPPQQASPGELPLVHVAFLKIGYFFAIGLNMLVTRK